MSSIGPQLPAHLQSPSKRKTPPSSSSPPAKRVANDNEIDLEDSSSDDDYGPKAPVTANSNEHPDAQNKDEINLDSDSEDNAGPAPAPAASNPPDEDSSSEDDYGPALPSASSKARIGPSLPPAPTEEDAAPKRDDWMLAPPPSGPLNISDPTKIAARSFSSKPGSSSAGKGQKDGAPSIWTETPEQKLARLQASVLGKSEPAPSSGDHASGKKTRDERDTDRKIKENFEAARGKSMVEEARERRKKGGKGVDEEGDDDPSKRAFDREKDMAIGGRFGGKERREMMESAKDTSRFSKGTFL